MENTKLQLLPFPLLIKEQKDATVISLDIMCHAQMGGSLGWTSNVIQIPPTNTCHYKHTSSH